MFSRTLTEDPAPGVTLVREDPGAFVRRLKSEPGKDICVMGGGDLAASLFAAGTRPCQMRAITRRSCDGVWVTGGTGELAASGA